MTDKHDFPLLSRRGGLALAAGIAAPALARAQVDFNQAGVGEPRADPVLQQPWRVSLVDNARGHRDPPCRATGAAGPLIRASGAKVD